MKINFSFKPYYKWITFNTSKTSNVFYIRFIVLNLIINGLPSIPTSYYLYDERVMRF